MLFHYTPIYHMVLDRIKLNLKLMMASSDSSTSLSIAHAAMDNKLITSKIYYKFYFNSILILTKLYFCLKNSPSHSYYMTKTIFLIIYIENHFLRNLLRKHFSMKFNIFLHFIYLLHSQLF